ncbi:hypothetical protein L7F22_015074 [Adiantum nelumboides]|nr:hypothetical protein [Adiantum nelumboides]
MRGAGGVGGSSSSSESDGETLAATSRNHRNCWCACVRHPCCLAYGGHDGELKNKLKGGMKLGEGWSSGRNKQLGAGGEGCMARVEEDDHACGQIEGSGQEGHDGGMEGTPRAWGERETAAFEAISMDGEREAAAFEAISIDVANALDALAKEDHGERNRGCVDEGGVAVGEGGYEAVVANADDEDANHHGDGLDERVQAGVVYITETVENLQRPT